MQQHIVPEYSQRDAVTVFPARSSIGHFASSSMFSSCTDPTSCAASSGFFPTSSPHLHHIYSSVPSSYVVTCNSSCEDNCVSSRTLSNNISSYISHQTPQYSIRTTPFFSCVTPPSGTDIRSNSTAHSVSFPYSTAAVPRSSTVHSLSFPYSTTVSRLSPPVARTRRRLVPASTLSCFASNQGSVSSTASHDDATQCSSTLPSLSTTSITVHPFPMQRRIRSVANNSRSPPLSTTVTVPTPARATLSTALDAQPSSSNAGSSSLANFFSFSALANLTGALFAPRPRRSSTTTPLIVPPTQRPPAPPRQDSRGVPAPLLKMLPVERYQADDRGFENKSICLVCQLEYTDQEKRKRLPCLHHFHAHCIDRWLSTQQSCPVCRLCVLDCLRRSDLEPHQRQILNRYVYNANHSISPAQAPDPSSVYSCPRTPAMRVVPSVRTVLYTASVTPSSAHPNATPPDMASSGNSGSTSRGRTSISVSVPSSARNSVDATPASINLHATSGSQPSATASYATHVTTFERAAANEAPSVASQHTAGECVTPNISDPDLAPLTAPLATVPLNAIPPTAPLTRCGSQFTEIESLASSCSTEENSVSQISRSDLSVQRIDVTPQCNDFAASDVVRPLRETALTTCDKLRTGSPGENALETASASTEDDVSALDDQMSPKPAPKLQLPSLEHEPLNAPVDTKRQAGLRLPRVPLSLDVNWMQTPRNFYPPPSTQLDTPTRRALLMQQLPSSNCCSQRPCDERRAVQQGKIRTAANCCLQRKNC